MYAPLETTRTVHLLVWRLWSLCLTLALVQPSSADDAAVRSIFLEQPLDHFDAENQNKFSQQIYIKDHNHAHNSPLFLLVGGHEAISERDMQNVYWGDLARQHNGTLVMIEHRYYGMSAPKNDPEMKFLNSRQSLYDLQGVLNHLKTTEPRYANSKVLMAGCGYGGTLVVWYKRLFPNNIAGGWASSPLIYADLGMPEYLEYVGKILRETGGETCYNRIKNGIAGLEQLIAEKRFEQLKSQMNLCRRFNFEDQYDVATLFQTISFHFKSLVGKSNILSIKESCDQLTNNNLSDVDTLIEFVRLKNKNSLKCINMQHINFVENIKYSNCSAHYYQNCNEFGHLSSSDGANHPFGTKFPKQHIARICSDLFNQTYSVEEMVERINKTNEMFGGREPNVEGIYMTYGTMDPLSPYGPAKGVYTIPKVAFSKDFQSISNNDSPEVLETKRNIEKLVSAWLEPLQLG